MGLILEWWKLGGSAYWTLSSPWESKDCISDTGFLNDSLWKDYSFGENRTVQISLQGLDIIDQYSIVRLIIQICYSRYMVKCCFKLFILCVCILLVNLKFQFPCCLKLYPLSMLVSGFYFRFYLFWSSALTINYLKTVQWFKQTKKYKIQNARML